MLIARSMAVVRRGAGYGVRISATLSSLVEVSHGCLTCSKLAQAAYLSRVRFQDAAMHCRVSRLSGIGVPRIPKNTKPEASRHVVVCPLTSLGRKRWSPWRLSLFQARYGCDLLRQGLAPISSIASRCAVLQIVPVSFTRHLYLARTVRHDINQISRVASAWPAHFSSRDNISATLTNSTTGPACVAY